MVLNPIMAQMLAVNGSRSITSRPEETMVTGDPASPATPTGADINAVADGLVVRARRPAEQLAGVTNGHRSTSTQATTSSRTSATGTTR